MRSILILTSCFLLLSKFSFSQLYTHSFSTMDHLVNDYFMGNTNVSNVSFSGSWDAIGKFDFSENNLGLDQGLIMTTGTIHPFGNDGPHGPNNDGASGIDNNQPGASEIDQYALNNNHNAAKLEFDFVAESDTFFIDYVFGNEEYMAYVNAGFNDIVIILISGPGIFGEQNIALLHNSLPVCTDNVNANSSSDLFVHNGAGNEAPYNESDIYIGYNGFTKILRAQHATTIDSNYHVKIIIADVGDAILDAGVFLSKNSLGYTKLLEKTQSKTINIFPNPSKGIINIDSEQNIRSIQVQNNLGQVVKRINNPMSQNQFDISDLTNGIYYLGLETNHGLKYLQLIVEN